MSRAKLPNDFMAASMGQLVAVHTELHRVRDKNKRHWEPRRARSRGPIKGPDPVGWIVGFRWLLCGVVTPGTDAGWTIDSYDAGEPTSFEETGPRVPCVLVSYWPTMKPVHVPLDGYQRVDEDPLAVPEPPQRCGCSAVWTDRDREVYRELAAEQPRDRRGRFQRHKDSAMRYKADFHGITLEVNGTTIGNIKTMTVDSPPEELSQIKEVPSSVTLKDIAYSEWISEVWSRRGDIPASEVFEDNSTVRIEGEITGLIKAQLDMWGYKNNTPMPMRCVALLISEIERSGYTVWFDEKYSEESSEPIAVRDFSFSHVDRDEK